MTRARRAFALSAAFYILVTVVLGRAVLAQPGSVILSDEGDPLFVAALLRWNATTLPLSDAWWQFPIFHPTRDAIAFSEHVLGLSPIATPLYWLTRDWPSSPELVGMSEFLRHPLGWAVLLDLLRVAVAGGMYEVPL